MESNKKRVTIKSSNAKNQKEGNHKKVAMQGIKKRATIKK